MTLRAIGLALAALLALASAAQAEGPAVSALNGKASLEAGAVGNPFASSALGVAQGSVAAPLGHSFGVQLDGAAATAFNSLFGGGMAHLFWRDPKIGLLGPVAGVAGGRGMTIGFYGGEGDFYAGPVTLGFVAGYRDAGGQSLVLSGGVYQGRLTVYPIPDLALGIQLGQTAGFTSASGRIEFLPELFGRQGISLFAQGLAGDNGYYRATAGLQIFFGPSKSLIRRHREDDPILMSGVLPALLEAATFANSLTPRDAARYFWNWATIQEGCCGPF